MSGESAVAPLLQRAGFLAIMCAMKHIHDSGRHIIYDGDCLTQLQKVAADTVHVTYLDPPFNQGKFYAAHDDAMDDAAYWDMMREVCRHVYRSTAAGGAMYFMQREKNAEFVMTVLRETGWSFQNLIIWKKKTSAVPVPCKFGKQYQIIVYATKGLKARVFNRLRINPELPANYKVKRENGIYVTDVWDDIRELTSGFFAGKEAIRDADGGRFHKQQSPIALLLRIILSSSNLGDTVLDPFAGTGTTLVTAKQLQRKSIGIELDSNNVQCIKTRLKTIGDADDIRAHYKAYQCTPNLKNIWGEQSVAELDLFDQTDVIADTLVHLV